MSISHPVLLVFHRPSIFGVFIMSVTANVTTNIQRTEIPTHEIRKKQDDIKSSGISAVQRFSPKDLGQAVNIFANFLKGRLWGVDSDGWSGGVKELFEKLKSENWELKNISSLLYGLMHLKLSPKREDNIVHFASVKDLEDIAGRFLEKFGRDLSIAKQTGNVNVLLPKKIHEAIHTVFPSHRGPSAPSRVAETFKNAASTVERYSKKAIFYLTAELGIVPKELIAEFEAEERIIGGTANAQT